MTQWLRRATLRWTIEGTDDEESSAGKNEVTASSPILFDNVPAGEQVKYEAGHSSDGERLEETAAAWMETCKENTWILQRIRGLPHPVFCPR